MSLLAIDIETFSDVDLPKCGVYAYTNSPQFQILLFAYAFDDEPTQVVDLARGEQLPDRVLEALEDETVTKTAFNAAFERTCISRYLGRQLSPASWQCTAVQSAMLALPLTLDGVGEVLNIKRKKLKEGAALLRYFSMLCKPTKANGGRTRNRPEDAPEMWERFKAYCIRDVDAEREIREKLRNYPIPKSEMELYRLDQEINDRGIMVDQTLTAQAVRCDLEFKERATAQAQQLTGLANPNSLAQVKGWLAKRGAQPPKLKSYLNRLSAAFNRPETRKALPSSISGLWKADLFFGTTDADRWLGTSLKINPAQLEGAKGLRIGIVPATQGRSDKVALDEKKNIMVCPIPYDGSFMELFYISWGIVQQFIASDAKMPKEVCLPVPADRQAARELEIRREFPIVDVVDALEPLSQPNLTARTKKDIDISVEKAGESMLNDAIVAPVAIMK